LAFNLKEKQKQTKVQKKNGETEIQKLPAFAGPQHKNPEPKRPRNIGTLGLCRTDPHNVHKTLQQQHRTATTNAAYKRAHNELSRTSRHGYGWMDGWE